MRLSRDIVGMIKENNNETLKESIIKDYEKEGYTYNKELDSLESDNDVLTSDFIDELIKLRKENEINAETEIPDEAIVACMSINRLVSNWSVKYVMSNTFIVDDNDYFDPYDYIDIDGFRDHRFYECNEYGYDTLKYLNEHAKLIVNLVLTDLDSGLWSVDLRTKTVQSLLNYISILVGLDVSKRVLEKRKEIKESSKLTPIVDINYIETEE